MESEYLDSSMSPEMGDGHSPDMDHEMDYPEEHEPHTAHPVAFSWSPAIPQPLNQLISVPADLENVHIFHLGTNYLFLELPVIIFFCMQGIDLNGTKGLLCVELTHVTVSP